MNWNENDWARLGASIRAERESHGLSRRALSESAGVSEKSIQVAEEGRAPRARWPQSLALIEKALGWPSGWMKEILEGEPPEAQRTQSGTSQMNERFAAWLRGERRNAGLSQAALAEQLSTRGRLVYQQTIAKIEQGERGIELDLAADIVTAFGSTLDVALGLAADARSGEEVRLRGMLARREKFISALAVLVNAELEATRP